MNDTMMKETSLIQSIIAIINSTETVEEKRTQLDEYHDYDLARSLEEMTPLERQVFYPCFDDQMLADIFEQLDPEDTKQYFFELPSPRIQAVLSRMEVDDLVDVFQSLSDETISAQWLGLLPSDKRVVIKTLIDYHDTVVGSIMNTNYVQLGPEMTVKLAIKTLVKAAETVEFINVLYVVNERKLVGTLSLKEIMSAGNQPDQLIQDIMSINLITVQPLTPNEEAIRLMQDYDFSLLPVVSDDYDMLGIISFDDMFETINYESDMDYSRLAGVTDVTIDEDNETVKSSVRKRIPWLIILLFINLITSGIVTGFEATLTAIPTLALFMPLILNMAGNTGTQSLGVVIRLFASNQLADSKDILKHLLREFLTGIVNGLAVGAMLFALVFILKSIDGTPLSDALDFSKVIAISIAISLFASTVAGTLIPILMRMIKVDPAVASGPFITTVNDIIALLIYFGLANLMISSLL